MFCKDALIWQSVDFLISAFLQSGHNIEKVREKMRELTKLICCIYPTSKLFVYILEGLKSKNNRTRIESVDHVGYMIDRYGVEVSTCLFRSPILSGLLIAQHKFLKQTG